MLEADCDRLHIILPDDGNMVHRIVLFPRDIYISKTQPPGPGVNRFKGTITSIRPADDAVRLEVMVAGKKLMADMPYHIFEEMDLAVNREVFLILKMRRIKAYGK